MKDFLGNELKVGDRVLFAYYEYAELNTGVIVKFTPQKVTIRPDRTRRTDESVKAFYSYNKDGECYFNAPPKNVVLVWCNGAKSSSE